MAEEIPLKIDVDLGEGAKSLRQLKQEFKEAQKDLDGLSRGTEAYTKALNKLGGIRDQISDLNQEINAFNPEGKVQAFSSVIGGLASGFQAATAASALFGEKNEAVEKTLLKVQAAMAFADGIKGVIALGDSFTVLTNILKSTAIGTQAVTAAQWLWNIAVNANPIALLVTALTALVAGLKIFAAASNDAAEKQARLNELQKEHAKILEAEIDVFKRRNAIVNESYESEIALMKSRGASIEEINKRENEIYESRRRQLLVIQGFRGQLTAEESKELLALTNEKILRDATYTKSVQDNLEKVTAKNKEEQEKQTKKNKEELEQREKDRRSHIEIFEDITDYERDLRGKFLEDKAAQDRAAAEKELAYNMALLKAKSDQEKEAAEKRKAAMKAEQDAEFALTKAGLESTQAMSDIFFSIKMANVKKGSKEEERAARNQFNINKALSASSTTLATIQGVQNALVKNPNDLTPEPLATALRIAQAISIGVKGAAAVSKILSTPFGGTGGATIPAIQAPTTGNVPQIAPPQNGLTELNPNGTLRNPNRNREAPTVKAYVLETDITDTQKRINTIAEQATIG